MEPSRLMHWRNLKPQIALTIQSGPPLLLKAVTPPLMEMIVRLQLCKTICISFSIYLPIIPLDPISRVKSQHNETQQRSAGHAMQGKELNSEGATRT